MFGAKRFANATSGSVLGVPSEALPPEQAHNPDATAKRRGSDSGPVLDIRASSPENRRPMPPGPESEKKGFPDVLRGCCSQPEHPRRQILPARNGGHNAARTSTALAGSTLAL